jgi:DNA-binding response OmpR family regulator
LILSARDTVEDRIKGLREGGDDYLVKPFDLGELLARVEALGRRAYSKKNSTHQLGGLTIDLLARSVSRDGRLIELTTREFAILEYLVLRQGEVISRTEIEAHVYDELVSPMSNVVDKSICVLRKKLVDAGEKTPLIHTRRGQGYIIDADST